VQTIWKGAISFGLVTIPVRLFAATQERDISFHQVHQADGSRIRYRRICEAEGQEVPFSEIAKGYELPDGNTVVLTKEDFANLPLMTTKTIEVLKFVPVEQIDPIYLARSYYLKADSAGEKPYVLLRDALNRSGQVAVVKVALRSREALATLRTRDDILLLQTMLWPDEVRDIASVSPPQDVAVRPQEIDMAQSYIETLSGDFDPSEYGDTYREALDELITAKVAGQELVEPAAKVDEGKVIDLMAALRASVEQAKKERRSAGELPVGGTGADGGDTADAEPSGAPVERSTAKKGTGQSSPRKRTTKTTSNRSSGESEPEQPEKTPRKAAAKKPAAKKATAKKTAAKSSKKSSARTA
jgi:DNA end-binding protein Ku